MCSAYTSVSASFYLLTDQTFYKNELKMATNLTPEGTIGEVSEDNRGGDTGDHTGVEELQDP